MRIGLVALLIALVAGGCSAALTVGGDVTHPAQVPLRAFPRVIVLSSGSEDADRMAERLAAHLDSSEIEVHTPSEDSIETLRTRGALPPGTVVVRVSAALTREDRPAWIRGEVMDCGPLGCVQVRRDVVQDIPVIRGRVRLLVLDGPSGRALQREAIAEEEMGPDVLAMRLRVMERLGARMVRMVDQRSETVRVELYPVDARPVQRALEAIEAGEWSHGASLLERFARSDAFGSLTVEEQARVLYDLGQVRRFDPALPADVRFARARSALQSAVRLHPDARYATAIEALDAHRRSSLQVRAQDEARDHNFRIARGGGVGVPDPPASYH